MFVVVCCRVNREVSRLFEEEEMYITGKACKEHNAYEGATFEELRTINYKNNRLIVCTVPTEVVLTLATHPHLP
jgi:hypothetical protein